MRVASASLRFALWLAAVAGCAPAPEDATEAAGTDAVDRSAVGTDSAIGGEPSDTSSAIAASSVDAEPTPFPDLETETVVRTYELWVVNRSRTDLRIYASAGAGRVTLDTVPGRDSVRVNVQVRARSVDLEAEDEGGRTIDSTRLELAPASSNRWEIPEPGGVR